jgi:sugar/nucleoside kinase (ribokinase family)
VPVKKVNDKFDVIGLGTSTVDILSLVDHFPWQEEVQQALDMTVEGGGPVATAMVTLARLGARVAMIDVIGDDWRGTFIRNGFRREGVCADFLLTVAGGSTSTSSVLVRRSDGARSIVFAPGVEAELSAMDVSREVIASAKYLHVNGRHWNACLQACRYARECGVQVSLDGGAQRYRPAMKQLVPLIDICIVARDFAENYTQQTDMWRACEALLAEGPHLVAITDGTNGSWIHPREGVPFHQPAYRLPKVVDTTGCGDSYHGAFLFGLARGMDLAEIASLASAVAALNTQQLGGRKGLPTFERVTAFLADQHRSVTAR